MNDALLSAGRLRSGSRSSGDLRPSACGCSAATLADSRGPRALDGAAVEVGLLDADDIPAHRQTIERAFADAGGFDVVVIAVGVLGAQAGLDADPDEAIDVMRVNFLGAGSLLLECLRQLRRRGEGTLVLLSSVAAERPRAANPIYGASKAGLDALAQGLSDAIASSGVRVLVVRPGFVKTRMTANLKPARFATTPDVVASATVAALARTRGNDLGARPATADFAVLRHLPRGYLPEAPAVRRNVLLGRRRDRDRRRDRHLDDHPRTSGGINNRDRGTGRVHDQLRRESRRRRRARDARRRTPGPLGEPGPQSARRSNRT